MSDREGLWEAIDCQAGLVDQEVDVAADLELAGGLLGQQPAGDHELHGEFGVGHRRVGEAEGLDLRMTRVPSNVEPSIVVEPVTLSPSPAMNWEKCPVLSRKTIRLVVAVPPGKDDC